MSSAAVDRSGSAEFEEAMTGALQPPEGGCQCEARAAMAPQAATTTTATPAQSSVSAPTTARSALGSLSTPLVGPAAVDRSAPVSSQVAEPVEPTSCGECGLPFSLDDVVGPATNAIATTASAYIGIPTGWTFGAPARAPRPANFEV